MLRNFFLIAFRSFQRFKSYTFINVLGLGLSIASAILIFSLVKYNLSFDRYHKKEERIFRVTTELSFEKKLFLPGIPSPLPEAVANDYSFTEKIITVFTSANEQVFLPDGAEKKFEETLAFAKPDFFEVFDFPIIRGDKNSLNNPQALLLSESKAKKYFGTADPMGKTIRIANKADFTVTGIFQDPPANTDRKEEIYISFAGLKTLQPWQVQDGNWLNVNSGMQCFLLLKKGVSADVVNTAFHSFIRKYYSAKDAKEWKFVLQPLSDIHLNTTLGATVGRSSLVALSFIGLFLIIAACINFINLATAQATSRAKEVGVRKVLGSSRPQLFWQFITETALIGIIATLAGLIIAKLALPYVNQLFVTQITFGLFSDVYLIGFVVLLLAFMTFSSGVYPGLIMAGVEPIVVLKGKLSQGSAGSMPLRKGLVVVQFAISQLLIIGTIVIVNQMRYSQQADLGFAKDNIVILPVPDNKPAKLSSVRSEFAKIPGVKDLTFCYAPPAYEKASTGSMLFGARPEEEKFQVSFRPADEHYAEFFNLKILAGRNVLPSDTVREFMVNEMTVKMLGLKSNDEVLGQSTIINGSKGTIVGVVKDFHNKSFHATIEPLAITTFNMWHSRAAVKIDSKDMKRTLSQLQNVWQESFPNNMYKQEFLDERIAKIYEADNRMMILIQVLTIIAVFIGCMSLYGLVSFMAAQKKREVAIRKVLGASIKSIVLMFVKEFGQLMVIAFLIAMPAGWYIMHNWLENFAYRVDISASVFVFALTITSLVVMLTIGYKSIATALADPSKSLRAD